MCRFKYTIDSFCHLGRIVSIHPMCRFKVPGKKGIGVLNPFQYILCVGSSFYWVHSEALILVSIHPMCRFKAFRGKDIETIEESFNTSYVSVQDCAVRVTSCNF